MKIAIINGSVREGRASDGIVDWLAERAAQHEGAEFEVVTLADFNVPILVSPIVPGAAKKRYDDPAVQAWSDEIDRFDGYVLVTPEYNHGVPGALKNAFDSIFDEWSGKAIAFVSYGFSGGIRAVEQWRPIVANFSMHDIRNQLPISLSADFEDGKFVPDAGHADAFASVLDDLIRATRAAKAEFRS